MAAINKAEVEMGLPANITGKFAGTAQAYQDALDNQPILIGTALLAVYIVLGMLYESLIHPLTIISTLPSAGVGALMAMVLFKSNLDIIGMIGIILLIGIVKKNAIMMIDFALAAERNEGMNSRDAIYQACLLRFRPDHDDDDVRAAGRACRWRSAGARARSCASRSASPSSAASWSARC